MKITRANIIVFCLFLFAVSSAWGQKQFNFEQFTVEDGLTRNHIFSIYRDHLGYVWIGTAEGLNKFDGVNISSYFHNPGVSNSLPNDKINFIVEDNFQNLWVGTLKGLALYSRIRDDFTEIKFDFGSVDFMSYCKINEKIVFATDFGIVIYDTETKLVKKKRFQDFDPSLSEIELLSLPDNRIIVASKTGLSWKYNLDKDEFTPFAEGILDGVEAIILAKDDIIWVATANYGIKLFDLEGQEVVDSCVNQIIDPKVDFVRDMVELDDKIWIATDGTGLFVYNKETKLTRHIQERKGVENSLPSNSLISLFIDDFENILVGSVRSGLIWIHEGYIQTFTDVVQDNPYGLSNANVITSFEDIDGNIWLGTDGGGLNQFLPEEGTFKHIKEFNKTKIVSICAFGTDKILVSCYRDYIRLFDLKSKKFITGEKYQWLNETSDPVSLVSIVLKNDQKGRVWKLSKNTEIIDLDGNIESVDSEHGWIGNLPSVTNSLQIINDNELLIGGLNGVSRINLSKKTITNVLDLKDEKWPNRKESNMIHSFAMNGDAVWISSTLGVFSYNCSTNHVEHHASSFFRTVPAIAIGKDSTLWIGTSRGLYRYFPDQKHYQLFGRAEGVRGFEYIKRSVLKTRNGDVYMGASAGLVKISANEDFEEPDFSQKISFANIKGDGAPLNPVNKQGLEEQKIRLAWDNKSLNIDLVVNEKSLFRKRIYKIFLEGYAEEAYETIEPQISISHLPSGNYTLKVWCNRADGSWSEDPTSLQLVVPLPWWKQWWFIGGIILLIVVLFILIMDNWKKRSALSLELQLERERKNQVKQLNEEKLVFFTNISHELRTPLSLLYGPLKELVNESNYSGKKIRQNIKLMYGQAQKMKRLVDQVMDMRRLEAGKDKIVLNTIPLVQWLNEFLSQYEFEFKSNNIALISNLPEEIQVECDIEKLDKCLSNLLSNAIKYSPVGGKIFFTCQTIDNRMQFAVADEGKGISEEDIPRVFDRFFQAKNNKGGSGVGLSFVRKLVEMQQGEIWVNNRPEGGAEFAFYLPLQTEGHSRHESISTKTHIISEDINPEVNDNLDFLKGTTLLVVEDDDDLRRFIVEGLSKYVKVIDAANGKEAWDLILSNSPDLIVSDVMMPEMDGFTLCRKIREDANVSHLPILLLTARSDGESRLKGYKSGADAYLSKPFSIELLRVCIINIFKNRSVQLALIKSGVVTSPDSVTYSNMDEIFLRKVLRVIQENMEDPEFDVNKLTAEFAMSRSSFYAKVKAILNMGANEYIKLTRINEAARLLKESQLTIVEISTKVGFANSGYFSTVFKDEKGVTPSKFRMQ